MQVIKIKDNIYWVGAIDWELRNFHGYLTQRGSSYNAYLIIDDKITLIDSVKSYLTDFMLARIKSIIPLEKIDYVICNHVEMDHSGAIPAVMSAAKNAVLLTSPNGEKGLKQHYNTVGWNFRTVKTGETLNTGKYNFSFVLTPMVHWPDNMVSYLKEENVLFSNDAFGQHLATAERFDDEYSLDIIFEEARKYYANIVLPYSQQVTNALTALQNIKLDIIAPSHGIIWRKNISKILEEYKKWSANDTDNTALIIYDTMWNSTKTLANILYQEFLNNNIKAKMINLQHTHISDIMTDVLSARYICVGSPTLNSNVLPTVAAFLAYLCGLAPKNRTALAFGSFGWGGQSITIIEDQLRKAGFKLLPSLKCQYIPSIEKITETAKQIITAALN